MTVQLVPTDDTPGTQSYVQSTTFEGKTFVLAFQYNQRCASWYLSIADVNGVDIYNGVKLVCGIPLLRKCKDARRPAGELVVLSSTTDLSPPSLVDLIPGTGRCQLLYVTSDWLALLAAGQAAQITAQLDAGAQASGLSTYGAK